MAELFAVSRPTVYRTLQRAALTVSRWTSKAMPPKAKRSLQNIC